MDILCMLMSNSIIVLYDGKKETIIMILKHINRLQLFAWDIVLSLLMAFIFTVSPHYIETGNASFTGSIIVYFVLYCLAFFIAAALIRFSLKNFDHNITFFQRTLNHKYALLILSAIMLLIWLPVLIILYPGTVINDTWGQFSQFVYTFYSDSTMQTSSTFLHRGGKIILSRT